MVYKFFFPKKPLHWQINLLLVEQVNLCKMNNLQMNFIKLFIRKFKKRTVYSSFKDNIWGADLADMQLISKFNKRIRFLLCVVIFLENIHGLFF